MGGGLIALGTALAVIVKKCQERGGCPNEEDRNNKRHEKETHHIVAVNAQAAIAARRILASRNVRISVQDQINKVDIPTSFHRRLHSAAYYAAVNAVIEAAYANAAADAPNRPIGAARHDNVWNALWLIKQEITAATRLAG